jgi:peptidoglycan hydrolase-like protein with peptidoglycan-binding domain
VSRIGEWNEERKARRARRNQNLLAQESLRERHPEFAELLDERAEDQEQLLAKRAADYWGVDGVELIAPPDMTERYDKALAFLAKAAEAQDDLVKATAPKPHPLFAELFSLYRTEATALSGVQGKKATEYGDLLDAQMTNLSDIRTKVRARLPSSGSATRNKLIEMKSQNFNEAGGWASDPTRTGNWGFDVLEIMRDIPDPEEQSAAFAWLSMETGVSVEDMMSAAESNLGAGNLDAQDMRTHLAQMRRVQEGLGGEYDEGVAAVNGAYSDLQGVYGGLSRRGRELGDAVLQALISGDPEQVSVALGLSRNQDLPEGAATAQGRRVIDEMLKLDEDVDYWMQDSEHIERILNSPYFREAAQEYGFEGWEDQATSMDILDRFENYHGREQASTTERNKLNEAYRILEGLQDSNAWEYLKARVYAGSRRKLYDDYVAEMKGISPQQAAREIEEVDVEEEVATRQAPSAFGIDLPTGPNGEPLSLEEFTRLLPSLARSLPREAMAELRAQGISSPAEAYEWYKGRFAQETPAEETSTEETPEEDGPGTMREGTTVIGGPTRMRPAGPLLRSGSRGPAVAAIQKELKRLGYDLGTSGPNGDGIDGQFGPATTRAVRAFQEAQGIGVDGTIGTDTWGKLAEVGDPSPSAEAAPAEPPPHIRVPDAGTIRAMQRLADSQGRTLPLGSSGLYLEPQGEGQLYQIEGFKESGPLVPYSPSQPAETPVETPAVDEPELVGGDTGQVRTGTDGAYDYTLDSDGTIRFTVPGEDRERKITPRNPGAYYAVMEDAFGETVPQNMQAVVTNARNRWANRNQPADDDEINVDDIEFEVSTSDDEEVPEEVSEEVSEEEDEINVDDIEFEVSTGDEEEEGQIDELDVSALGSPAVSTGTMSEGSTMVAGPDSVRRSPSRRQKINAWLLNQGVSQTDVNTLNQAADEAMGAAAPVTGQAAASQAATPTNFEAQTKGLTNMPPSTSASVASPVGLGQASETVSGGGGSGRSAVAQQNIQAVLDSAKKKRSDRPQPSAAAPAPGQMAE